MIRDILVHVDGSTAGVRRIAYALALAKQHEARLTGIHVTPFPDIAPRYKPSKLWEVAAAVADRAVEDLHAAEASFKSAVSRASISVDWLALEGSMSHQICDLARATDIVVLGQYEAEGVSEHHPLSLAEEVALGCGRPVLVVPAAIHNDQVRRALIAWDGGREAVRAVHDALPILRQSEVVVEVVASSDAEPDQTLQFLFGHLERHHVRASGDVHFHANSSTAETLVNRVRQAHFDLLVMGAYSHSVWLEFLFGGTTSSALSNSSVPILISH